MRLRPRTGPRRRATSRSIIRVGRIEECIVDIRGVRTILDTNLAAFYGVTTSALNQAVERNLARFPADFMFRVTAAELRGLKSQIVMSNPGRGGRRNPPRAFTDLGVAMLSSVLTSPRAIQVNIAIMRAFAQSRGSLAAHRDLVRRLDELEHRYDGNFAALFTAIRKIMANDSPISPRRRIGFRT